MAYSKDWMNNKWRPMMGYVYMVTCITDFIIFPVAWAVFQHHIGVTKLEMWQPLTLQGAGLYHVAMGAILGVTAWTRGQEKITAMNSGYAPSQPYNQSAAYNKPYNARPQVSKPADSDYMPPRD
jgi:hypothetical protein